MSGKEKRSISTPAQVKRSKDGKIGSIYGYPIVYNKDSEDMGFIERISPGAAKKALKRSDIRGLKNHDPSLIFGRSGVNMKFTEDENGLRYEATPIDTVNYREIAKEVESGLLTGQSFAFTVAGDEWDGLDTEKPTRTITEIGEILDCGPVTYPAYQDTSVGLRSLEEARKKTDADNSGEDENKLVLTAGEETFEFSGDDRFDRAAEKINSLRPDASPTTPAPGSADGDPTVNEPPDTKDAEDILARIKKTTERYKK